MTTEKSLKIITLLNQNLANTLDLKLQAKQAHWNLKGPNFIAVHELFDKVASAADEYADMQAERIVQLGGIAFGTVQEIKTHSKLNTYPIDIVASELHIAALSTAIQTVADSSRQLIDETDALGDKVTADLLTEVTRELDKWLWFVSAHKNP